MKAWSAVRLQSKGTVEMTSQGSSLLPSPQAQLSFLESGAPRSLGGVWGSGRKEAAEWGAVEESRDRNAGDGCSSQRQAASQAPT